MSRVAERIDAIPHRAEAIIAPALALDTCLHRIWILQSDEPTAGSISQDGVRR